jgi:hypothetical protein
LKILQPVLRDPEFSAPRRHLLAIEQAGDKPKPLVHDDTPQACPPVLWGKIIAMPEYLVTWLRKDFAKPGLVTVSTLFWLNG